MPLSIEQVESELRSWKYIVPRGDQIFLGHGAVLGQNPDSIVPMDDIVGFGVRSDGPFQNDWNVVLLRQGKMALIPAGAVGRRDLIAQLSSKWKADIPAEFKNDRWYDRTRKSGSMMFWPPDLAGEVVSVLIPVEERGWKGLLKRLKRRVFGDLPAVRGVLNPKILAFMDACSRSDVAER